MGRRKIEIKAIKDDRNRSVTFLKRKGGLFKKAHELSVLCSVDVAVFIFGTNKKLYEYSSTDMNKLIQRYHFHGGPNEHKGPSDFNGGNDEEEEDDEHGTPPQRESMEPQMMPPHFPGQAPYQHMRQHEPSASPPINGMPFQHPGHPGPRGHTPQPQIGSRPASRQDIRRMNQPPPPQQPVNGYAYMPNPAIYNPQAQQSIQGGMQQQGPQYQYQQHAQHGQPQPPPPPPPHMQQYMDEQRRSAPPTSYPQAPQVSRVSPSPPQPPTLQLPQQQQQQPPHVSPPPPQPQHLGQQAPAPEGAMLAPMEPIKPEFRERPTAPLLNTDSAIKKMPQRKQHSIFTPIDENRSILSQHFASFAAPDSSKGETPVKFEPGAQRETESRSQSIDAGARSRSLEKTSSPPAAPQSHKSGRGSVSTIPETGFTPPSRSNTGGARPLLRLEIPDEPSDGGGSATAASDTHSPRANAEPAAANASRRPDGQASNSMVLPPPSPSGPPLLSAGATGPPNPFARPAPQQQSNGSVNIDTPVSALPSRFMNNDFLPSPSSFDPYWSYRGGNDNNTLPSPLNFATPVVGSGPSFLREEISSTTGKRKTPDPGPGGPAEGHDSGGDAKRAKVDA